MKYFVFCALFCCSIILNAQNNEIYNYKNTPLSTIIKTLEEKHNVTFSFANDLIKDKYITIDNIEVTWFKLLDILETQTGLEFQKIDNNQVIITPPKNNTKICGYLLDALTKQPIANATITSTNTVSVTTTASGYFSFKKENTEFYVVSIEGYETKEFLVSNNCDTIYLNSKDTELDEVVILGYITSGIDRNKDGSLKVTSKTLGVLPGLVSPDMLQSIQLIPGITSLDESATGIQIRGGSPDQNLILFDGIKLYSSGYLYGMFSALNPFATEKATVFRSGTSASYGDRISGIIDISSGDAIPEKTQGGLEIDGLSINGFVKTPLSDKSALYIFARRSYTDLWKTPTYKSYADKIFTNFGVAKDINGTVLDLETDDDFTPDTSNNEFTFTDVNTKLILKPNEKNSFSVSALYNRNRLDFDFGNEEVLVDSLITENKGLSFQWKHKSNTRQVEKITVYYSGYHSFYQNNEIKDDTGDDILDLTEINIRKNDISDFGINFSSTTQIKDSQQLTLGYQLSYTDLDVLISKEKPLDNEISQSNQDDSNLKNALFGEYTFNLKNKGFINTGIRFVHYNSLNTFLVEPRVNLEYPLNNRLRAKTAIERRHQPISQLIEFNHTELRLENNLWRLSDDENYPLLSSNQISAGLLYHYNNLNIDVDAYYKELKGLTTFTNGFSNPLENLEEGKSTIKGLDVLLKYRINNYKIWAGYTFNDITFQFPNLQEAVSKFPGNNNIRHLFRLSNTLKINHWQFSLGWQYRTGKPVTPVDSYEIKIDADGENAGVVNFGAINSEQLPDFHRLDASILHDFKINTLDAQLGLSFLNIYNRKKPLNIIYKAERKPLDDGGIPVEGTTGATLEDREVILEQVIQRFSLGFTPNISFRLLF